MRKVFLTSALLLALALPGCRRAEAPPAGNAGNAGKTEPWEQVERDARGQTVTLVMWQGDPYINAYMTRFVAPRLAERYGVTLKIVSGQGNAIVSTLMTEREAGKAKSAYDLAWINGETFYQLRQIDGLYGPFTDRLPNGRAIDFGNRFIRYDFQQEVRGYECPWGNVQLALIANSARVPEPPRTKEALAAYLHAHPGRFTIDTAFTGLTFLKMLLIDFAGGEKALAGPFDAAKYAKYSAAVWKYLNDLKPYLWKRGETFPSELSEEHQMFANGELDFTMSNNDGEVDNKVRRGLFPGTSRAFVFATGTIQNSHYLGIVKNAPHRAAALVTVNFLLSPEAQLEKAKPEVWGDGTVLDIARLPEPWRQRFAALPKRQYGPERAEIQSQALQELAPEYMIHLHEDFRRQVLEK